MWAIIGLWRKSSTGIGMLLSNRYRPKYTQRPDQERERDYSESSRTRRGNTSPAVPRNA
jgi:hypothetical protein